MIPRQTNTHILRYLQFCEPTARFCRVPKLLLFSQCESITLRAEGLYESIRKIQMKTPFATKMFRPLFRQRHSAAELLLERRALRVILRNFEKTGVQARQMQAPNRSEIALAAELLLELRTIRVISVSTSHLGLYEPCCSVKALCSGITLRA